MWKRTSSKQIKRWVLLVVAVKSRETSQIILQNSPEISQVIHLSNFVSTCELWRRVFFFVSMWLIHREDRTAFKCDREGNPCSSLGVKKNTGIQTGNDWNIDSRNLYQKPDKFSEVWMRIQQSNMKFRKQQRVVTRLRHSIPRSWRVTSPERFVDVGCFNYYSLKTYGW